MNNKGQGLVEYSLILVLVAVIVIVIWSILFGPPSENSQILENDSRNASYYQQVEDCIDDHTWSSSDSTTVRVEEALFIRCLQNKHIFLYSTDTESIIQFDLEGG